MRRKRMTAPKLVLITLVLLMWVAVGSIGMVSIVRETLAIQGSENWPSVQGEVIESRVETRSSRKGRTYAPQVTYTYAVEGTHYSGTRQQARNPIMNSPAEAQGYLQAYPVSAKLKVFYQPANPQNAVLKPGLVTSDYLIMLLPGLFVLLGLLVWVLSFWRWQKDRLLGG